ncbi:CzcA family heavy metal efflux protein [Bdellovibrio bacteriovorus W]|nr:CzcA family heavy metal efflux protein [Bdellovibrio bacteriovorus W]
MNKIIYFSVYHRGIVLFLTALLVFFGWYSFTHLSIDAVPDITNNQVQVFAEVSGLSAEEVERSLTFPIENSMGGVSGVTQVRSLSRFGLSVVTVVFEDKADIYRARQLVSERLQSISSELPQGVKPKLGPITTGLGEIFFYALSYDPDTRTENDNNLEALMDLRSAQEWLIKPRLLTVPGVAEINTIGGFEKQFHVIPDPEKLRKYGVSFSMLVDALSQTNQNVGGGYVQQSGEQFVVQGQGLLSDLDDIRNTPLRPLNSLTMLQIKDVATVKLASELRTGAALVRGKEAVLGTAMMLLGENSRDVSDRVAEKLNEISKTLPQGIKVEVLYDRSDLVNKTLGTIEHNLLTGAALVVVILLLLLGNLRAALITAVVIPFSLLLTFILMKRFGISGNLLSLGALDFGIIVDGAVIVLDHCVRRLHEAGKTLGRKLSPEEVKKLVFEATVEIRTAAGFGELIVIVAFLPVLALSGIEGKMFQPMAATFAIAVFCALALSFTTVPALASIFLGGRMKEHDPWLMRKAEQLYKPIFNWAVNFKLATVSIGVVAILIGGFLFSRLGGEFLPQMDEASRALQFVRPVNISLDQAIILQEKSEQLINEFPQVQAVFSRIGTAEVATDPMGVNLSDTFITFKERNQWPKGNGSPRTWGEITKAIVDRLEEEIPGQRVLVSQPIQMRFNELLEGTRADVSVKIFGDDFESLVETSQKIAEVIRTVPGAGDAETELQGTSPVLKIIPNQELLASLGIPKNEVLETVRIALGGEDVGYIYEGVRRFPIVVRLDEQHRSDLSSIRALPVELGERTLAPLSQAATIEFDEGYGTINREQAKRRVAVLVNPRGVDTESFVRSAQEKVTREVKLPEGTYIEWGGNFQNLIHARDRLLVFAPLAIFLVLAMVYFAFGSVTETLIVFLGVPFALVGGVIGLMANGLPFSISAGVGFIALSGIAVLNGVVLVNCFNDLRKKGLHGLELVSKGTLLRLRPVLMTALVAIFGFVPMMLSTGVGAEVQRPLASVIIGGLISSTILTLFVLPVLILMFERFIGVTKSRSSLSSSSIEANS